MREYPAGHGMDADWFATDRDGHVAHFRSGESGAVPESAYLGEEAEEVLERIAKLAPCTAALDPAGIRPQAGGHVAAPADAWKTPVVAFVDSLENVGDLLRTTGAERRAAVQGEAIRFATLSRAVHGELHGRGVCLGCSFLQESDPASPARRGFYAYEHLTQSWVAGPYGRSQVPARPLVLGDLPEELREVVSRQKLDRVCFASTPALQPVEHAPCVSGASAWLSSATRRIAAIPGQEDEFRREFAPGTDARAAAEQGGMVVEEPPAAGSSASEWQKRFTRPPRSLLQALAAAALAALGLGAILRAACR